MSVMAIVYAALKSDTSLTSRLAGGEKGIYHLHGPDAGSYPVIVYSTLYDSPLCGLLHKERVSAEAPTRSNIGRPRTPRGQRRD